MKATTLYLILFLGLFSCNSPKNTGLTYTTSSEKALQEYRKGWVQIMDEGNYGPAESSYRKALEYDPDFLVGKSVLARLTLNLDERLAFENEVQNKKEEIKGDERLVLDVYNAFVQYTNLRDQSSPKAGQSLQDALKIAEINLRQVVYKYPKETYLKAEYLEILHSLYGPKRALDSLVSLTLTDQKENPFILGFSASLHAELKEFEIALQEAEELEKIINNPKQPKSYVVYADIYFQKGDLQLAKTNADKAHKLDPLNLDASRLKKKIDILLKEKEIQE